MFMFYFHVKFIKVMDFAIQYISHLKQLEAVLKKTSKKNHGEFSPLHNNKPKLPKVFIKQLFIFCKMTYLCFK